MTCSIYLSSSICHICTHPNDVSAVLRYRSGSKYDMSSNLISVVSIICMLELLLSLIIGILALIPYDCISYAWLCSVDYTGQLICLMTKPLISFYPLRQFEGKFPHRAEVELPRTHFDCTAGLSWFQQGRRLDR